MKRVPVTRVSPSATSSCDDLVAIEEPLEIRLRFWNGTKQVEKTISITMRTPGDDFDLATGFLFTEGIVREPEQIEAIRHCGTPGGGGSNVVRVELREDAEVDLARLERHFYTSSSCGVCGKTSIEALHTVREARIVAGEPKVRREVIRSLPHRLRESQPQFDSTGGLHASALFSRDGELLLLREDVGRHNALDKVVGHEFRERRLPANDSVLLLSGRASFELVQKAAMGGIAVVAAIGAPSSLAVELADSFGMTLVGFVRDERFNIYCGEERIAG